MQLTAKTENNSITVYNSNNEIVGQLHINFKTKTHQISIDNKTYQLIQEKWLTKVTKNNQTIYYLKINKFWGTIKIEELNKDIRGIFGFTWDTQLRDSYKQTWIKIRSDKSWKNNGLYFIQLNKENTPKIEILLTLYGHILGSIMKQNAVLYT